jgi:hypothetical protein
MQQLHATTPAIQRKLLPTNQPGLSIATYKTAD